MIPFISIFFCFVLLFCIVVFSFAVLICIAQGIFVSCFLFSND